MGLIKGCAEPISDAYLDIESDDPVNLGHWQPKDASNAPPALALTGQLEGWTALDAWDGKVDARLALVGYAIDQSSYTRPVTFDRQDIESLTPGQILTGDGVMTSGQFDRLCQDR